jgi:type II restriction/modification system DNA methylase subunit YeeA
MGRNRPSGAFRLTAAAAHVAWSAWRILPSTPQTRRTLQEWEFTLENPMPLSLAEFVSRWKASTLTERAAAQSHFIDLCEVLGQPHPAAADQTGDSYTFEKHISLTKGGKGFADVWKRQCFGWEYKGKHKDLNAAYLQLNDYREDLENPPLLVVCDLERFEVHTNFTGTRPHVYRFTLDDLLADAPTATCAIPPLEVLRDAFTDPEQLRPEHAAARVTEAAATEFAKLAVSLEQRNTDAQAVAHFLMRLLFCLFADSIGLLPDHIFRQMIERNRAKPAVFTRMLRQLFAAMSSSGNIFGAYEIHWFNGGLFADDTVFDLTSADMGTLRAAAALDWSTVEPAIFGTLFERSLDPRKRSQLGAHYTSKQDILLIVEPVVIAPLQARWLAIKAEVTALAEAADKLPKGAAYNKLRAQMQEKLSAWLETLSKVRILDPACGSGNFLYLALRRMLDLWREAYLFSAAHGLPALLEHQVHPSQLYGLETNIYAHELASVVVWIGYLQWLNDHGIGWPTEPILRKLDNIQHRDAILAHDADGKPVEPAWPEADFIIGNPPFLGDKRMRAELGDGYVEELRTLYDGRVPGGADLVTYWFERARAQISASKAKRAGLLATNSIRMVGNRPVLESINASGGIFMAWSDRPWVLDGAAVRVSLVGFDNGSQTARTLDGQPVEAIHSDLTASANVTSALTLPENANLCFLGVMKGGPFDITAEQAKKMLAAPLNPNGKPNSDVVKRRLIGRDVVQRNQQGWLIDFGERSESEAALYELPFEYVRSEVKPFRDANRDRLMKQNWWLHGRTRPALRKALNGLSRCIVTPEVAKHRIFVWMSTDVVPDHTCHVIARGDDYAFGMLQSRAHEVWSLAQGAWMGKGNDPRYSSARTFETYPFPWPPSHEPKDSPLVEAIAEAARELVAKRDAWLNPPDASPEELKKRTLTNLYNARPSWLAEAHRKLDAAVFAAYGWPVTLTDAELLEHLLALNHERAAAQPPAEHPNERPAK